MIDKAVGILKSEEIIVPAFFSGIANIIGIKVVSFSTRPGTIFKDVAIFKHALFNEVATAPKRFFRLTTKANDKITGNCNTRNFLSAALQHLDVIFNCVKTLHALEHFVATRLHRHMKILANLGQLAHRIKKLIIHILRIISDEFNPFNSRRIMNQVK